MDKKIGYLVFAVCLTLCFGFWGYTLLYKSILDVFLWNHWLDVLGDTLKLFTLQNSSLIDEGLNVWQLSLAKLLGAVTVLMAATATAKYILKDKLQEWKARYFFKKHVVICGLGDKGYFAALDIVANKQKVIVVDKAPDVSKCERLKDLGVVVIQMDARDPGLQKRANLNRASDLVLLTDCDSANMELLENVIDTYKGNRIHCHIHLTGSHSKTFFEKNSRFSIEVLSKAKITCSVFNVYEQSSILLFSDKTLGSNADTINDTSKPVKILISGFDKVGESVLIEAMLLGHFHNKKKINITVLDENIKEKKSFFFERYHQVEKNINGEGLNLWDVNFISRLVDAGNIKEFNHVVSAYDDEGLSMEQGLLLFERYRMEGGVIGDTFFSYYAPRFEGKKQSYLNPFGSLELICRKSVLLDNSLEASARLSHNFYAISKLAGFPNVSLENIEKTLANYDGQCDNSSDWLKWENQALYKRRSNVVEKRHIPIKLRSFNLKIEDFEFYDDGLILDAALNLPCVDELDGIQTSASNLLHRAGMTGLSLSVFVSYCDRLAEVEHNRWNAFHVLDNWVYGPEKNELIKTHDCLLSWDDLYLNRPDTIKYDYKNIYQIPEVLANKL